MTRDFPNPYTPQTTEAIRHLVDLTADRFDHQVIAIDRQTPEMLDWRGWLGMGTAIEETSFAYGTAARYVAPPLGLHHRRTLNRIGDWLAHLIGSQAAPRPAVLVGHKLTIEGIAVERAARKLGIPYAISIQGNTDDRIIAARPDLQPLFRRIFHGASTVFPFAPWSWESACAHLGTPAAPCFLLPCATELDTPIAPRVGGNGLVTAFHLRSWQVKNFDRVLGALRIARAQSPSMELAVLGGGDDADSARCRALGLQEAGVRFEGRVGRDAMPARLNAATALVMPSRRESFGMTFIEALFAGIPIIYPAGQGVDGYFDHAPFAIAVDPESEADIACAMQTVMRDEEMLKIELARWQKSPDAGRFRRAAIAAQFAAGIEAARAAD